MTDEELEILSRNHLLEVCKEYRDERDRVRGKLVDIAERQQIEAARTRREIKERATA